MMNGISLCDAAPPEDKEGEDTENTEEAHFQEDLPGKLYRKTRKRCHATAWTA